MCKWCTMNFLPCSEGCGPMLMSCATIIDSIPFSWNKHLHIVWMHQEKHIAITAHNMKKGCGCVKVCGVFLTLNSWKTLINNMDKINKEIVRTGESTKHLGNDMVLDCQYPHEKHGIIIKKLKFHHPWILSKKRIKLDLGEWQSLIKTTDKVEDLLPELKSLVACELTHDDYLEKVKCEVCNFKGMFNKKNFLS